MCEHDCDCMKWTEPEFGRARVVAAGKILAGRKQGVGKWAEVFDIVGNWRSSHAYPLQVFSETLRRRARRVCPGALVAQRLKRLPSIRAKLKKFKQMQLSQMQDLGGGAGLL